MKVKVKARPEFRLNADKNIIALELNVKFKYPGDWFSWTYTKDVCSLYRNWERQYEEYEDFLSDCKFKLLDKEGLIALAKEVVLEEHESRLDHDDIDGLQKDLLNLKVDYAKGFEIEVDID